MEKEDISENSKVIRIEKTNCLSWRVFVLICSIKIRKAIGDNVSSASFFDLLDELFELYPEVPLEEKNMMISEAIESLFLEF